MSPDLDAELAALLADTDTHADDPEQDDDGDPFTELVNPDIVRVDLVERPANGVSMLISKQALHPTPKEVQHMPTKNTIHVHVGKADDLSTATHADLVQQATSGSAEQRKNALAELGRRVLAAGAGAQGLPDPASQKPAQPIATPPATAAPVSGLNGDDLTPAPSDAVGTPADANAAEVAKVAAQIRRRPGVLSDAEAVVLARAHVTVAKAEAAEGATTAGVALVRMRATAGAVQELTRLRATRAG